MRIAEHILFQLARTLYRTEIAHSSDMKTALQHIDAYDDYRAGEINRIMEAVEDYRVPISGKTIVDLGCNDGAISIEYLRRGAARVVGLDIDARAVQRARDLYHDARLTFIQNTIDSILLDDGSADVVICYDVFEHVSHPAIILKELSRILTPAGTVLIGTSGWFHPFAPHLWSVMPVPWAHVFFAEHTLLRVCRRVYHSPWYTPNMHDYGPDGQKLPDKYTHEVISTDYLNKYLIQDFERAFLASGFLYETHGCIT